MGQTMQWSHGTRESITRTETINSACDISVSNGAHIGFGTASQRYAQEQFCIRVGRLVISDSAGFFFTHPGNLSTSANGSPCSKIKISHPHWSIIRERTSMEMQDTYYHIYHCLSGVQYPVVSEYETSRTTWHYLPD